MPDHRRGFAGSVALLFAIAFTSTIGTAFAQANCQPWLRAARQEAARGHEARAEEALNIYRECVRQTRKAVNDAARYGANVMTEVDPTLYGVVIETFTNPRGPRVVHIPGYRPNLIPGRPPGPIGGRIPKPAGAGTACPGGCPPTGGATSRRGGYGGATYGQRGAATYGALGGTTMRYGGSPMIGARSGFAGRPTYGTASRQYRVAPMRRMPY